LKRYVIFMTALHGDDIHKLEDNPEDNAGGNPGRHPPKPSPEDTPGMKT
jgi:hypothetical protein